MTVSIVTVYFLIPPFSLISYITIYILISYVVFRKGYKYFFLIVTTETVTDSAVLHSLLFFSKASHHEEFLGSLAAEVTEGVILRVLWQAEVRLEAAVGLARLCPEILLRVNIIVSLRSRWESEEQTPSVLRRNGPRIARNPSDAHLYLRGKNLRSTAP